MKSEKFINLHICTNIQMDTHIKKLEDKAKYYKALSEPVRLKIIEYLLKKKTCACICELSGITEKEQSVVFRHVQILKDAGIIETRKNGCFLECCVKDKSVVKLLEE